MRAIRRIDTHDDIAIIAMACRLPGAASTPEQYWDLLARGGDGIIEVPKDRWDAEALYDADPEARGKSYCRAGGFVEPIDLFDAPFFGVSPREARALDPMQRMVLETTWEAFERAGCTMEQLRGSNTGAFIGVGKSSAYHEYRIASPSGLGDLDGYVGPGSAGWHDVRPGLLRLRPGGADDDGGHRLLVIAGHDPPRLHRAAPGRVRPCRVRRASA